MVAKKTPSPAFEYVVQFLKGKPEAAYAEVQAGAEDAGFRIYPIVYGRAKAHLKLVPVAPRGTAKARVRAAKAAHTVREGTGSNRQKASEMPVLNSPMQSLEAVLEQMRAGERERERYRHALEQIGQIIQSVI